MIPGDYKVINRDGRISIDTLTSPIDNFFFDEAFTVGSHKTENLGVERIISNIVSNPNVRAIIICGRESFGHYAGQALYSLWENGTDEDGRIIGAKGPIPYIENIDERVISRFREQILYVEDMIGIEDREAVRQKMKEILERNMPKFDKLPMDTTGMSRKKRSVSIPIESTEKLTVANGLLIDPLCFTIECRL
ncbi:MAG: tetrahydromethanopterin S-methyltransferase subunit A [archaeon]